MTERNNEAYELIKDYIDKMPPGKSFKTRDVHDVTGVSISIINSSLASMRDKHVLTKTTNVRYVYWKKPIDDNLWRGFVTRKGAAHVNY